MFTDVKQYSTSELTKLREAISHEINERGNQLAILTDTLEALLAAGANTAAIDAVLIAIDAIDAAADDEIPEPEGSDHATRQQVITMLRAEGYSAPGFDALVTLYHRDLAELEYLKAETDTRGQMVRAESRANYSARRLWFCNDRELRKHASEEMLNWFDQNRRLTRAQLRDNLLGRTHHVSGYYSDGGS